MKDQIIERLLTQGHITISMADTILNDGLEKATILTGLKEDGVISINEVIVLLKDGLVVNNTPLRIVNPLPVHTDYNPSRNNPHWHITYSNTKPVFEYSDTSWPTDKKENNHK